MPSKTSTKTPKKAEKTKQDKKGAMSGEQEVNTNYTFIVHFNIYMRVRAHRISWICERSVCLSNQRPSFFFN